MIASTCSRVRPVRRAIGFATDLATRPRIPVRDALPISTALSCAVIASGFPEHAHSKRASRGRRSSVGLVCPRPGKG